MEHKVYLLYSARYSYNCPILEEVYSNEHTAASVCCGLNSRFSGDGDVTYYVVTVPLNSA